MRTIDDVVTRLRGEFLEMPGLCLTREQTQRLCGIERRICQLVLASLMDERFLHEKPDGRYARVTDGPPAQDREAAQAPTTLT